MFPLLLALFIAVTPVQPTIQIDCGAGPPWYECTMYEGEKCTLWEGHGAGCSWYVDVKYGCHCYEWIGGSGGHLQEILCPWGECQGGSCKACNEINSAPSPDTWSKVKGLYR